MRRREFMIGGAAAAWPVTTLAQQAERSITRPRVAFLGAESRSTNQHFFDAFRQGTTEHGYIESNAIGTSPIRAEHKQRYRKS